MLGRGRFRHLGDEIAVGERWRQRRGQALADGLNFGDDAFKRQVIAHHVVRQHCQIPFAGALIEADMGREQGRAAQVDAMAARVGQGQQLLFRIELGYQYVFDDRQGDRAADALFADADPV